MRGWILALVMAGGVAWGQTPPRNADADLTRLGADMATARVYAEVCVGRTALDGGVARVEAMLRDQAQQLANTEDRRGFLRGAQAVHAAGLQLRVLENPRNMQAICPSMADAMLRLALSALLLTPPPPPPGAGPPLQPQPRN